jgi:hypothetical protein
MTAKSDIADAKSLDQSSMEQLGESETYLANAGPSANPSFIAQAATLITHAAEQTLWSAIYKAHAIVLEMRDLSGHAASSLRSHQSWITHILVTVIPDAIKNLKADIAKALKTAEAYAFQQATAAYQHAHRDLLAVRAELLSVIHTAVLQLTAAIQLEKVRADQQFRQAEARADQQFAQAEADIANARSALQSEITADVTALSAQIIAGVSAAEQMARQLAVQAELNAVADVDHAVESVTQITWPPVTAMIGQLKETLGNDFPQVAALLTLIPQDIPVTAPAAVAAADTVIPPILRLLNDCVVPQCRDLGPLRSLLHDLGSGWFDIALLAWLVFCITDPTGAAADTTAVADPVVSPVMSTLVSLLGAL